MPLLQPFTRGDGLHVQLTAVDVVSMRMVGSIPGVVVLAVAARNGPGMGTLSVGQTGLQWTAPGSSTPGPASLITVDGSYLLEDGADASKWVRVQVITSYLASSGSANVFIGDTYNGLGPADVDASDASAGVVTTTEYTLKNVGPNGVVNVTLWLDPSTPADLTVSSDGTNFYSPTTPTDAHALKYASIAPGASANFWTQRTIAASTASDPSILNELQFSWTGY